MNGLERPDCLWNFCPNEQKACLQRYTPNSLWSGAPGSRCQCSTGMLIIVYTWTWMCRLQIIDNLLHSLNKVWSHLWNHFLVSNMTVLVLLLLKASEEMLCLVQLWGVLVYSTSTSGFKPLSKVRMSLYQFNTITSFRFLIQVFCISC